MSFLSVFNDPANTERQKHLMELIILCILRDFIEGVRKKRVREMKRREKGSKG